MSFGWLNRNLSNESDWQRLQERWESHHVGIIHKKNRSNPRANCGRADGCDMNVFVSLSSLVTEYADSSWQSLPWHDASDPPGGFCQIILWPQTHCFDCKNTKTTKESIVILLITPASVLHSTSNDLVRERPTNGCLIWVTYTLSCILFSNWVYRHERDDNRK